MLLGAGLSVNEPLSTVDDVAGLRVLWLRPVASFALQGGVVDKKEQILAH